LVHQELLRPDDAPKEIDLSKGEMTLARLERETSILEEEQYFPKVPSTVVHRAEIHNEVVQVDQARVRSEARTHDFQSALKGRWGVDEAKQRAGDPERRSVWEVKVVWSRS